MQYANTHTVRMKYQLKPSSYFNLVSLLPQKRKKNVAYYCYDHRTRIAPPTETQKQTAIENEKLITHPKTMGSRKKANWVRKIVKLTQVLGATTT